MPKYVANNIINAESTRKADSATTIQTPQSVVPEVFDRSWTVFTEEVDVDVSIIGSYDSAVAQDSIRWSKTCGVFRTAFSDMYTRICTYRIETDRCRLRTLVLPWWVSR